MKYKRKIIAATNVNYKTLCPLEWYVCKRVNQ